jgi:hypothetical protein
MEVGTTRKNKLNINDITKEDEMPAEAMIHITKDEGLYLLDLLEQSALASNGITPIDREKFWKMHMSVESKLARKFAEE